MVVGKMRYVREFSAFMKGLIRYSLDSFKVLDSVLTHGAHRVLVSWCPGGLIHCQVVTTPVFVPIIQYCAKNGHYYYLRISEWCNVQYIGFQLTDESLLIARS